MLHFIKPKVKLLGGLFTGQMQNFAWKLSRKRVCCSHWTSGINRPHWIYQLPYSIYSWLNLKILILFYEAVCKAHGNSARVVLVSISANLWAYIMFCLESIYMFLLGQPNFVENFDWHIQRGQLLLVKTLWLSCGKKFIS